MADEPLIRCEFTVDTTEQARLVARVAARRPRRTATRRLNIAAACLGAVVAVGGAVAGKGVLLALGVLAFMYGGFQAYQCGESALRRSFFDVYERMPSAGQPTRVDVFEDHLAYSVGGTRGEWPWSHWTEAWVSQDEAVVLMTGQGAGMLFIPAGSTSTADWLALCDLARSRLPPPP